MNTNKRKIRKKAFTLIEMILVLIIMTLGWNIMFTMYRTFLSSMAENQWYKNEMVIINNLNNLYSFTNNFFTDCKYQNDTEVKCSSKKTDDDFLIDLKKEDDVYKIVITDTSDNRAIEIAKIWLEQSVRKQTWFKMIQLTDVLTALEYKTNLWKKYYIVFPY